MGLSRNAYINRVLKRLNTYGYSPSDAPILMEIHFLNPRVCRMTLKETKWNRSRMHLSLEALRMHNFALTLIYAMQLILLEGSS